MRIKLNTLIILTFFAAGLTFKTNAAFSVPLMAPTSSPFQIPRSPKGVVSRYNSGMVANQNQALGTTAFLKTTGTLNSQTSWASLGCDSMMGDIMMYKMSPKQQQEFLDQTVELRKQLVTKRFDYIETTRRPDTTFQDLAGIEKEMLSIRLKILDKIISNNEQ